MHSLTHYQTIDSGPIAVTVTVCDFAWWLCGVGLAHLELVLEYMG